VATLLTASLTAYPDLSREDVSAALEYAAKSG
jgi:uncharacterized protein (DUF433 family)